MILTGEVVVRVAKVCTNRLDQTTISVTCRGNALALVPTSRLSGTCATAPRLRRASRRNTCCLRALVQTNRRSSEPGSTSARVGAISWARRSSACPFRFSDL